MGLSPPDSNGQAVSVDPSATRRKLTLVVADVGLQYRLYPDGRSALRPEEQEAFRVLDPIALASRKRRLRQQVRQCAEPARTVEMAARNLTSIDMMDPSRYPDPVGTRGLEQERPSTDFDSTRDRSHDEEGAQLFQQTQRGRGGRGCQGNNGDASGRGGRGGRGGGATRRKRPTAAEKRAAETAEAERRLQEAESRAQRAEEEARAQRREADNDRFARIESLLLSQQQQMGGRGIGIQPVPLMAQSEVHPTPLEPSRNFLALTQGPAMGHNQAPPQLSSRHNMQQALPLHMHHEEQYQEVLSSGQLPPPSGQVQGSEYGWSGFQPQQAHGFNNPVDQQHLSSQGYSGRPGPGWQQDSFWYT